MRLTSTMIVGAGPIGIETACALKALDADYLHVEAGQVGQTISWYPRQVKFFSSTDRIALAGVPFQTADQSKATREEYLAYLRSVVQHFDLRIQTFETVHKIFRPDDSVFEVHTQRGDQWYCYQTPNLILAIGDMHHPRLLHIPGEELPHVSHYFDEPHRYFQRRVLIVGGRNSAVEAAIRCHRLGAKVMLSYRREELDERSIKYWLLPEIRMLIHTGQIEFFPATKPKRISNHDVLLASTGDPDAPAKAIAADDVLLLTGYEMDTTLLKMAGAELQGEPPAPVLDEQTMMTTVPGLYVAGTAAAGTQVRFRLFIENCHEHVDKIVRSITGKAPPFDVSNRTNQAFAEKIAHQPES